MPVDLTFLGHSTVLVEIGGKRLLTDPVLNDQVVGVLDRRSAPVPAAYHSDVDAALISHAHHDHLDVPSLRRLGLQTQVVLPRGLGRLVRRAGFGDVVEANAGQSFEVGSVTLTATPARHSGYRVPFGPRADALGWIAEFEGTRVYFAGDTDAFDEMAQLQPIDVALLPVWGWGPRLGRGHLDPERAAEALTLLRPRIAVPIHWGTLWPRGMGRVARDRLEQPPLEFARRAAETAPEVEVIVLPPGESLHIT